MDDDRGGVFDPPAHSEEYPPTVHERLAAIERALTQVVVVVHDTHALVDSIKSGLMRRGSL